MVVVVNFFVCKMLFVTINFTMKQSCSFAQTDSLLHVQECCSILG